MLHRHWLALDIPSNLMPPSGLLARLRWIFLLMSVVAVISVLPVLMWGSLASPALRIGTGIALLALCHNWRRLYRHGKPLAPAWDVAEGILLTAIIASVGPLPSLGVLYVSLYFRSLYGSGRRVVALTVVYATAFLTASQLVVHATINSAFLWQCAAGLPITAGMMFFIGTTAAKYERGVTREIALRELGAALLAASDVDAICAATLTTAILLLRDIPNVRVHVTATTTNELTAMKVMGNGHLSIPTLFQFSVLPESVQANLQAGRPFEVSGAEARAIFVAFGFPPQEVFIHISPLLMQNQLRGVISVTSAHPCPVEIKDGLAVLSSQATLALSWIAMADNLRHQALHDSLTQLPNRQLLQDRLQQALLIAQRDGAGLALLLLDLNKFKEVNDTLGHQVGDVLLMQVASRLRDVLRASDTIARLGGDEFAIILPTTDREGVSATAEKLSAALDAPFWVEDHRIHIGGSIGIALSSEHSVDGATLLRYADVAMYVAKRAGISHTFYCPADKHDMLMHEDEDVSLEPSVAIDYQVHQRTAR